MSSKHNAQSLGQHDADGMLLSRANVLLAPDDCNKQTPLHDAAFGIPSTVVENQVRQVNDECCASNGTCVGAVLHETIEIPADFLADGGEMAASFAPAAVNGNALRQRHPHCDVQVLNSLDELDQEMLQNKRANKSAICRHTLEFQAAYDAVVQKSGSEEVASSNDFQDVISCVEHKSFEQEERLVAGSSQNDGTEVTSCSDRQAVLAIVAEKELVMSVSSCNGLPDVTFVSEHHTLQRVVQEELVEKVSTHSSQPMQEVLPKEGLGMSSNFFPDVTYVWEQQKYPDPVQQLVEVSSASCLPDVTSFLENQCKGEVVQERQVVHQALFNNVFPDVTSLSGHQAMGRVVQEGELQVSSQNVILDAKSFSEYQAMGRTEQIPSVMPAVIQTGDQSLAQGIAIEDTIKTPAEYIAVIVELDSDTNSKPFAMLGEAAENPVCCDVAQHPSDDRIAQGLKLEEISFHNGFPDVTSNARHHPVCMTERAFSAAMPETSAQTLGDHLFLPDVIEVGHKEDLDVSHRTNAGSKIDYSSYPLDMQPPMNASVHCDSEHRMAVRGAQQFDHYRPPGSYSFGLEPDIEHDIHCYSQSGQYIPEHSKRMNSVSPARNAPITKPKAYWENSFHHQWSWFPPPASQNRVYCYPYSDAPYRYPYPTGYAGYGKMATGYGGMHPQYGGMHPGYTEEHSRSFDRSTHAYNGTTPAYERRSPAYNSRTPAVDRNMSPYNRNPLAHGPSDMPSEYGKISLASERKMSTMPGYNEVQYGYGERRTAQAAMHSASMSHWSSSTTSSRAEEIQERSRCQLPARPTLYYGPHKKASYAPDGTIMIIQPNSPRNGQSDVVIDADKTAALEQLHNFPVPLTYGKRNEVIKLCQMKFQQLRHMKHMHEDPEGALALWKYLEMLVTMNGKLNIYSITAMLYDLYHMDNPVLPKGPGTSFSEFPMICNPSQDMVDLFNQMCVTCRQKDALEYAAENNMWGQAFHLAFIMGGNYSEMVGNRFMHGNVAMNNPIRTLHQIRLQRIPTFFTATARDTLGDWRCHLAMLLSQKDAQLELIKCSLFALATSYAEKGLLYRAHFCLLMCNQPFEPADKVSAKLVLFGMKNAAECKQGAKYLVNNSLQMTMVYEFGRRLAEPNYCIPTIAEFKLSYMQQLIDHQMLKLAYDFCEHLSSDIIKEPKLFTEDVIRAVWTLAEPFTDFGHETGFVLKSTWISDIEKIATIKQPDQLSLGMISAVHEAESNMAGCPSALPGHLSDRNQLVKQGLMDEFGNPLGHLLVNQTIQHNAPEMPVDHSCNYSSDVNEYKKQAWPREDWNDKTPIKEYPKPFKNDQNSSRLSQFTTWLPQRKSDASKEMILPDDSSPTIIWDESQKCFYDNEINEFVTKKAPGPPPVAMLPAAETGTLWARKNSLDHPGVRCRVQGPPVKQVVKSPATIFNPTMHFYPAQERRDTDSDDKSRHSSGSSASREIQSYLKANTIRQCTTSFHAVNQEPGRRKKNYDPGAVPRGTFLY